MLITPPPNVRKKYGKMKPLSKVPVSPAALVLMAASYDGGDEYVVLSFDRNINVTGLNGSAIYVSDGDIDGLTFNGIGGTEMVDDQTVKIQLVPIGGAVDAGVILTVSGESGIVAVDDGGTWAGVTGLMLPFP